MPNMPTQRDLLQAHGNGKGDKERSPGWRENLDAIDFHRDQPDGFFRTGPNRSMKVYGICRKHEQFMEELAVKRASGDRTEA